MSTTAHKISISLTSEAAHELARIAQPSGNKSKAIDQLLSASAARHKAVISRKCIAAYGAKNTDANHQTKQSELNNTLTKEDQVWLDADFGTNDLIDEGW